MSKEINFHFNSPSDSPGYLLGQLTLLWQRKQKIILDPLGLTQTQFILLAALGWLSKHNEYITQADISNQSNADRMMVSKVLTTLENKKFITRKNHPIDTRAKLIELTNNGANVLQKALIAIEKADVDFFSVLDNDLNQFRNNIIHLTNKNKD